MTKSTSQDESQSEQNSCTVLRILVVEDHEPSRTALLTILAKRKFVVVGAATFRAALELVERNQFDLLISDIGLPDGNGFDLMVILRERGMQGISVTGHGRDFDIEQSRHAGFSYHFTKPIAIGPLLEAINKMFESRIRKQQPDQFTAGTSL